MLSESRRWLRTHPGERASATRFQARFQRRSSARKARSRSFADGGSRRPSSATPSASVFASSPVSIAPGEEPSSQARDAAAAVPRDGPQGGGRADRTLGADAAAAPDDGVPAGRHDPWRGPQRDPVRAAGSGPDAARFTGTQLPRAATRSSAGNPPWRLRCTRSRLTAAGVTPETLPACPIVAGRCSASFSETSADRPRTAA